MTNNKNIKVCHFSSVHSIHDTRVFERECSSLAIFFDVTFIGIGNFTGVKNNVNIVGLKRTKKPWQRFFSTIWIALAYAIKTNAKIYHIHDAEMVPFGILLSICGKKVIYDIHENTKADILLKTWIKPWLRYTIAYFYDGLLKIASNFMHFIPVVWHKEDANLFYAKPNKFTVIQNFAPLNIFKKYQIENRQSLPNNLFYIGMIKDMYYDIYPLFSAMLLLKENGIHTHLHCVGYFGLNTTHNFNDFKDWNKIKDQVTFYGKLSIDDAYEISKNCKIGICLKNQPESMVASHERKLFEYIAIGLPAIFCNATIYKNINQQYQVGLNVDLNNVSDLMEAIKSLIEDKELFSKITQQQLIASNSILNWELEFNKLLSLYYSLLG